MAATTDEERSGREFTAEFTDVEDQRDILAWNVQAHDAVRAQLPALLAALRVRLVSPVKFEEPVCLHDPTHGNYRNAG